MANPYTNPYDVTSNPYDIEATKRAQPGSSFNFATAKAPQKNEPVDFTKISGPWTPKQEPRPFLPSTQITAGKPSFIQTVVNKLPSAVAQPLEYVLTDLHDGLFGSAQSREVQRSMERQGIAVDIPTALSNQGLLPFLGRTNTDKVEHIASKLTESGVEPVRAASIAFYDVFGQGMPDEETTKTAKQRLGGLAVTPAEQSVLTLARIGQTAGSVADVANILPFGMISAATKLNLVKMLLKTDSTEGAAFLLRTAKVPEDLIATYAPAFAKETTKEGIQKGVDNLVHTIETTRQSSASTLDSIRTAPELFQFSRRFEQQGASGAVPEKVTGIMQNLDAARLAKNPIEVGVFDQPVTYTLPSGKTVQIEANTPYVISGHNRLEVLRQAQAAGTDLGAIDKYVTTKTYPGTQEGVQQAIRDSIMTNVKNKSIKDIEILDNAINGNLDKNAISQALDYNAQKAKYLNSIVDTFVQNNLTAFWNGSVAPKLAALKNLDWGALQERLNFVQRVAQKVGAVTKNMPPEQVTAVQSQLAPIISDVLATSKVTTLSAVEKGVARKLDVISTGGFKNTDMTNLFGDVVTQTQVAKKVPVQALEAAIADSLKSPLVPAEARTRLGVIMEILANRESAFAKYVNAHGGLTKSATKTQKLLQMFATKDPKVLAHEIATTEQKGAAAGMAKAAAEHQKEFAAKIEDVAKETGLELKLGPSKTADRILEKAMIENGGDVRLNLDANRATVIIQSSEDAAKLLEAVKKRFTPTRIKDKFDKPIGEFKGGIFNVKTPYGQAEIAVTTPEMWRAKAELGGQQLYEQVRSKIGDFAAAEAKMKKLYADAWSSFARRVASASETSVPSARALSGEYPKPVESTVPQISLPSDSTLTGTLLSPTRKNLGNVPVERSSAIPEQYTMAQRDTQAIPNKGTVDKGVSVGEGTQAPVYDAPPEVARAIEDRLPKPVGKILSEQEKYALIQSITKDIKDPSEAAMSASEYGKILDRNDKNVADYYNRLLAEKRATELALEAEPKNAALRENLARVEGELKSTEQSVVNMRIRGDYLDEVPVVPDSAASAIDSIVNSATVRGSFKDITGLKGQFRDYMRNFKAFFGGYWPDIKRSIIDPFHKSKGDLIDEMDKLASELEQGVTEKYSWARGSKESAAVQDWGERAFPIKSEDPYASTRNPKSIWHDEEAMLKDFGPETTAKIKAADKWFRREYGRLIDEINVVREKIYPNNPDKLIPKRGDYYRHFRELGDGITGLMNLIETPAGIDPTLVGTSGWTTPKSKWASFAQLRKGPQSERDAIGGFLDYVPAFAYGKHIDPHIGVFRYLRRRLAEMAPRSGTVEDFEYQPGVDNMLQYLTDYANDLAGKTNPMERYLQNTLPGGRKTFKTLDWANKRIKSNSVLGNAGTLIAQLFNLPQGIASAKQYAVKGIGRSLGSIFWDNAPAAKSIFLKERYHRPLTTRFKLSWFDHPLKKSAQDSKNFAAWLLGVSDEISTRFIWNSHYEKALAKGIADPIDYADQAAKAMVAGRGVGEVPLGQKAKIFQLVAPFQIEVGNTIWALRDMVAEKDIAGLVIFAVGAHLLNKAYQDATGNRGTIDPIQSLGEGGLALIQEWEQGHVLRGMEKFAGRQAGEILANLPLGQTVAAMIPESTALPGGVTKAQFFGTSPVGRYPVTPLVASVLKDPLRDPLFKLLLPWGGNQLKKTTQGLAAVSSEGGRQYTKDRTFKYRLEQTPEEYMRAALFGQNALPEAQAYYKNLAERAAGIKKTTTGNPYDQ